MPEPLADIIRLLRPRAIFSKEISGAGRWAVRYAAFGQPAFCAIIEGRCRLAVDGEPAVVLEEGDFVLLPATPAFSMSGLEPATPVLVDPAPDPAPGHLPPAAGSIRYGRRDGPADLRQFGGYFTFAAPDAAILVALLPRMIHVRGVPRLAQFVRILGEEAADEAVGRDLILARLVEVLLIEALRRSGGPDAAPGLLRGLADPRIAAALRSIHRDPAHPWTVETLAREAGLSRSAFFDRFARTVGFRPMEYLLTWRIAVAKDLMRSGAIALDDVARRVGYGSASSFSAAFSRTAGEPPGRFMRRRGETIASA